jgi:hypothetical protein
MKRIPISVVCLGIIATVVFYGSVAEAKDPRPEAVDTVVHPDGSKEYTLINAGRDTIRGNEDDMHWVLRIPEEIYSHSLEDFTRSFNKVEPGPSFQFNRDLTLQLDVVANELGEVALWGQQDLKLEGIYLAISSPLKPYNELSGAKYINDHWTESYQQYLDNKINKSCRRVAEIHPGVFTLRTPTEQEYLEMDANFDVRYDFRNYRRGCDEGGQGYDQFGFYISPDIPVGRGYCFSIDEESNTSDFCKFSIWMGPDLVALARFKADKLEHFIPIYRALAKFFIENTDYSKSKNINFRKF